jgi:hypothetical protein
MIQCKAESDLRMRGSMLTPEDDNATHKGLEDQHHTKPARNA